METQSNGSVFTKRALVIREEGQAPTNRGSVTRFREVFCVRGGRPSGLLLSWAETRRLDCQLIFCEQIGPGSRNFQAWCAVTYSPGWLCAIEHIGGSVVARTPARRRSIPGKMAKSDKELDVRGLNRTYPKVVVLIEAELERVLIVD